MKLARIIRDYFTLGIIVPASALQPPLVDGQPQDAVPVMNLLQQIVDAINANAAAASSVPTLTAIYVPPGSVGGTPNAITLTPSPPIGAYSQGQNFVFQAQATSTAAVTLNVSGLGAQNLVYKNGNALSGLEIQNGGVYQVYYGPGNKFYLMNSSQDTGIPAFTPTLSFGGSSVGITYSSQLGFFVKNGDIVFGSISLSLTSKGAQVGTAAINGLPFAINATFFSNSSFAFGYVALSNVTFGANSYAIATANPGTTTCGIGAVSNGGAGPTPLTDAAFTNTSGIGITFWYPA